MSTDPTNTPNMPAEDPVLDSAEERLWAALEEQARRRLWSGVADPRLIVLEGLDRSGRGDALNPEESRLLASSRDGLLSAESSQSGVRAAIDAVGADAALFDEAWQEHLSVQRPAARRPSRRLSRWPARIGLGFSALVLAALVYFSVADEVQRVTIDAAEQTRVVQLADGSTVRLAPGSSMSYVDGTTFDRSVDLTGNAYFDITSRSTGFSVRTANATTTVLGTRFGVSSLPQATDVVLISGRVAVSPRGDRQKVVVLEPGERTSVRTGQAPSEPVLVDVVAALPWLDLLVFKDTPMGTVVERLKEVRGVTVTLGPGISELAVTGSFTPEQPTAEILQILASTLGVTLQEVDGTYALILPGVRLP